MTSFYIGLVVLLAALLLFFISRRQRSAAGLPGGRVVYSDTRAWGKVEKPFFDHELGLAGRPDYLVEHEGRFIPVEVKTGRTPSAPYDSHIFQLAAYCYLVHKNTGKRPTHGIIHYPNRNFAVDYTPELESSLLDMLAGMRIDERRPEVFRSHEDPSRCRSCGFRDVCEQKLA
jgi:CRISPR-associated exonuclease Cas4